VFMKQDEQRIAIAEFCGWTQIEDRSSSLMMPAGFSIVGHPPSGAIIGQKKRLPDYPEDLNAMNDAEMFLEKQWPQRITDYCVEIRAVILRRAKMNPSGHCGEFRKISCHADVKAEAFVRVIGRWKQDETEEAKSNS
ncbi:MAG TPA: hypothetical protein VJ521_03970, partial [Acidobacteriota bacterium]|nr:hypothetical protein [Acidobacteriota bacterium]